MSKAREHRLDIFSCIVLHHVRTSGEWKRLRRTITSMDAPPDAMGHTGTHGRVDEDELHVVIYTRPGLTALDAVATCAHEAVHAAGKILDHVGQSYDGQSETLAYLVDWLTVWLMVGVKEAT